MPYPLSTIPCLPSSALEEILDRPIEIYSSEAIELVPMKIDFDSAAAVSQPASLRKVPSIIPLFLQIALGQRVLVSHMI